MTNLNKNTCFNGQSNLNDNFVLDFTLPSDKNKLLLHSCCAPCSGPVIEKIHQTNIDLTIYFYNPNIHPKAEYEIRKLENKRFADKLNIPFIDADY
ncbi:MAG: epoxyqueuosine reductase QueH, partial [Rickettsiales bacterium]